MQKGEKVLAGAVGVIVVGLLALATPAVAPWLVPAQPDAAARTASAVPAPIPSPPAAPAPTGASGAASATATMSPDGEAYQSVGDGLSIPAKGPGDCPTWAAIHPYGDHDPGARLRGTITDLGPTTYASGVVGVDSDGRIATYTVASGDTGYGIGDRLCLDYVTLLAYNGKFAEGTELQPGDVLILRP